MSLEQTNNIDEDNGNDATSDYNGGTTSTVTSSNCLASCYECLILQPVELLSTMLEAVVAGCQRLGIMESSSSRVARIKATRRKNQEMRELPSLDSISKPYEEHAAETFPTLSRDCPGPIMVLGDSTLLCLSEPTMKSSSDSGGGSNEENKDLLVPAVDMIVSTITNSK